MVALRITFKDYERSKILPDLQANKLACSNFMDAGRRHFWVRDKGLFLQNVRDPDELSSAAYILHVYTSEHFPSKHHTSDYSSLSDNDWDKIYSVHLMKHFTFTIKQQDEFHCSINLDHAHKQLNKSLAPSQSTLENQMAFSLSFCIDFST